METIGYYAFDGCKQAGDVIVPESVKQLDENDLRLGSACRIFLKGALKNINASKYWNGFWNSNLDNRTPFYEFNKDQPSDEGNYWHYDTEGNIQIW